MSKTGKRPRPNSRASSNALAGEEDKLAADGAELQQRAELTKHWAELEQQRAELAKHWAELEQQRAELEQQRAELEREKATLERQRAELGEQKPQRAARLKSEPPSTEALAKYFANLHMRAAGAREVPVFKFQPRFKPFLRATNEDFNNTVDLLKSIGGSFEKATQTWDFPGDIFEEEQMKNIKLHFENEEYITATKKIYV